MVELEKVVAGEASIATAARRLGMSYRQGKRMWRRYCEEGANGLVHRSRGKRSNRRISEEVRQECLEECRGRLVKCGPTLAAEKLAEFGVAEVDHETLRRWMAAEGLWSRHRKREAHRQWRERKEHFGELVQMDGSFYDWFERGDQPCLMNMVDDATGRTMGRLFAQETTAAAMRVLWAWIERYGVPQALYTDWKNVYLTTREPTLEEQLAGELPRTVFGLACARLGIKIIGASSPQAKGRVERNNGVYQNRFPIELRLRGICTIDEANKLLEESFCDGLDRRFAKLPHSEEDWHRAAPGVTELEQVFVSEESRVVQNDWTVRYENRFFQLTGPKEWLPRAKNKVLMQRRLDASLHILYRSHELAYREIPLEVRLATRQATAPVRRRETPRPASDHPWRRPFSPHSPLLMVTQPKAQAAPTQASRQLRPTPTRAMEAAEIPPPPRRPGITSALMCSFA
jgi:transposase